MEQVLALAPWIWLALTIITMAIGFIFSDIDAFWFTVGSAIALLLSILDVHIAIQLSSFILATTILLFTLGRWIRRRIMTKNISTNSDSLIGKEILILEEVTEHDNGSGVIDDVVWTVTCQAGINVEKGKHAIIIAIDENKLVVTNKGL